MVLISVETCLLCRVEFVAWVFCIYYACQSDAQPDTRELLFCHREPNTHTHTNLCANYVNLRVRQVNWKPTLQICISVNCGTISAPHALQILKKETQKHYALSQWNLEILFLLRFVRKLFSLIFRKSIYALSMPTCSTPAQSCIKFQKKKPRLSMCVFFWPSQPTHTLWLFLNKQINQSDAETIGCNSRPKASD